MIRNSTRARTDGARPEPHALQHNFATLEGEARWAADMHALFAAGALDEAEALLAEALSAVDSDLAWLCLELPREVVVLAGWEEMSEAIALHEGEPITGLTIAIGDDADRAFEKGAAHHPHILLGLFTDEAYPFSSATAGELVDETHALGPIWAGREEDIEIHLDIDGLDPLNTRLNHHKNRHFFRDGEPAEAPLSYVEFVLGCWWRALRWHQAVAACAARGLPRAMPVLTGMVEMRPEVAAVHRASASPSGESERNSEEPRARPALAVVGAQRKTAVAGSFGEGFIQRRPAADESPVSNVIALRRINRAAEEAAAPPAPPPAAPARPGLLARLFGRRRG